MNLTVLNNFARKKIMMIDDISTIFCHLHRGQHLTDLHKKVEKWCQVTPSHEWKKKRAAEAEWPSLPKCMTRTDGHRLRAITHLTFYSKPLYCVLRFANGRRKLGGLMRHDSESYLSDSPCNCDASNCTRRPGLAIEFLPQVSLVLVGRVLQ